MLAPAKMIVMDFGDSLAPSLAAVGSLARMASGFAEKEKPLRGCEGEEQLVCGSPVKGKDL